MKKLHGVSRELVPGLAMVVAAAAMTASVMSPTSSGYAQTPCPTVPVGPQPAATPAIDVTNHGGRQNVVGSRYSRGDLGAGRVRLGENVFVVETPAPPPPTPGVPRPCMTPIWRERFVGAPVSANTFALVTISAQADVMAAVSVFTYTNMQGAGEQLVSLSSTAPSGLPADLVVPTVGNGLDSRLVHRHFGLLIPAGAADSRGFQIQSSLNGVVSWRVDVVAATSGTQPPGPVVRRQFTQGGQVRVLPVLRFRTAARTVPSGDCSAAVEVETVDGNDALTNARPSLAPYVAQNAVLALNAAPGDIFLDNQCQYPTIDMLIANPVPAPPARGLPKAISTNMVRFHFRSMQSGPLPLSVGYRDAGSGTTAGDTTFRASQQQTVTPLLPAYLQIAGPTAMNQNDCSAPFKVRLYDLNGNEAPVQSNRRTLTLSGSTGIDFFNDPACAGGLRSITVDPGQSQATFYVRGSSAAKSKVQVVDNTGGGSAIERGEFDFFVISQGRQRATRDRGLARRQAIRLFERLAGLPIALDNPRLKEMEDLIVEGDIMKAAHIATENDGFINVVVRNMVTPLSNRMLLSLVTLNDFVTTWMGIVRDDRDARELLTGNYVYVDRAFRTSNDQQCADSTVYRNNSSFRAMTDRFANLRQDLVPVRQCVYNNADFNVTQPVPLPDPAGLLTTRTWGQEHLFMGTNRRGIEFAAKIFLCKTMPEMADSAMPDWNVRRDVDRAPGGDPQVYQSSCRSCHGGLDSMSGAYAFFDSYFDPNANATQNTDAPAGDWRLFYVNRGGGYDEGSTMPKNNRAANTYPPGWVVGDDAWVNNFTENRNRTLAWSGEVAMQGRGMNSLGRMLANSQAFSSCMAKRVFTEVCKREPESSEQSQMSELASDFQASGYNMRRLFERAATLPVCLGGGE